MPVIFGPALRRLADRESDEGAAERRDRPASPEPTGERSPAVTTRRVALGALVAGVVAWVVTRLRRRRTPPLEPPFSR